MATFKLAKKDAVSDTRTNIYDLHEKKLEYFELEKKKLGLYISSLNKLKKQYNSALLDEKYTLIKQIKKLEELIDNINNDTELNEYLLEFFQTIQQTNNIINLFEEQKNKGQMDFFYTSKVNNSKI